ncbi:MAG: hypothetical protein OXC01_10185 [Immundisolibacterales bacterium]|nr:hypothetical protein [Immundisolibacterales bacterium]
MIEILGAAWSWSEAHQWVVWAVAAGSLGSLVLSVVLVSMVLIHLPADHYSKPRAALFAPSNGGGLVSLLAGGAMLVVRNVLGWMFVLAGFAMLVLPGQGLLSILAGLVLIDFPGKRRFELRLLASPVVRDAMNWLRRRAGRPPFDFT